MLAGNPGMLRQLSYKGQDLAIDWLPRQSVLSLYPLKISFLTGSFHSQAAFDGWEKSHLTCKADYELFSDYRFILFVTKRFPLIAKIILEHLIY